MRDDFTIPNMGEAPQNYDKGHINRVVRNVEMTFRTAKSKGPATFTELTADNFNVNTISATTVSTPSLTVFRPGFETVQYYTFTSTSAGQVIISRSDPANAKPFLFDNTTDALNTFPTGGANGYTFRLRGADRFMMNDNGFFVRSRNSTTNAVYWLQDSSGVNQGVLYWDNVNDYVELRAYADDGSTVNTAFRLYGDTPGDVYLPNGKLRFPAAQTASTDANTLDDYEEGTWTPILGFGGASTGITYSTQEGSYVKVGQIVLSWFRFILTNKGSATGAATISGLPFVGSIATPAGPFDTGIGSHFTSMAGLTSPPLGYVQRGNAFINLMQSSATTIGSITDANMSNATSLLMTIVYRANT